MKRILVYVLFAGIFAGFVRCSGRAEKKGEKEAGIAVSKLPTITLMDSATFDFGTIKEGEIVEHTFAFRNDGAFPLIINNISTSCGCTTPEWPRDPVAPKATSSIRVQFDSKNKVGSQSKTITVYANTEKASHELRLTGMVNAAEKAESTK
jgi:hypothetical protein